MTQPQFSKDRCSMGSYFAATFFIAVIVVLALWRMEQTDPAGLVAFPTVKSDNLSAKNQTTPPVFSIVSTGNPTPSVHSATAVELENGDIRAFWFGGTREGAQDVRIWTGAFDGKTWSQPTVSVDRDFIARSTGRYTRKLGKPGRGPAPGREPAPFCGESVGGRLEREFHQSHPHRRKWPSQRSSQSTP